MLASSILGLKTDIESIDVPADGKKAAYAGEYGQYRTRGTEWLGMQGRSASLSRMGVAV